MRLAYDCNKQPEKGSTLTTKKRPCFKRKPRCLYQKSSAASNAVVSLALQKPQSALVYLRVNFIEVKRGHGMGEWKAQVSFRVRRALRAELEAFAAQERRSLGNLGELILEWGVEQLKAAGSTHRLLKYKIRPTSRQEKGP